MATEGEIRRLKDGLKLWETELMFEQERGEVGREGFELDENILNDVEKAQAGLDFLR